MRDAGAILLGKTNVSEFAAWWDSVNVLFGATANPHDHSRTAGGSSGGEAAALASGMSPLGLGSDLGGSIRNPCHFVGVFGLKPGRDSVPFAEHAPLPLSPGIRLMGVVGPMARYAEDLELALGVLASRTLPAERPARVAVYEEDGLQPVSRDCRAAVRRAAAALGEAGHELAEAAPPNAAEVRSAFDVMLATELLGPLPALVAGREDELSPYLREMIAGARGFEPDWSAYFAASGQLARLEEEADRWLERHPVALCPAAPEVAPTAGRRLVGRDRRRADAPRRQADARHLRERARAAGRVRPGHALGGRAPGRRAADRPPRVRAHAARAGRRARGAARRMAAAVDLRPCPRPSSRW
jgi:Asp-tRNA(Asn)/Glu-tRNA(Gln) amidotransferase A subunit family amidase